jgi:pimeloyl-[acyl-carrier protein] methyl ester esterase
MFCQTIGNGKDIVLIHGWGFDSTIMKKIANILALNYRVAILDLPGYGVNWQRQFPDTLSELADSISHIIPSQSTLIGWSLGGLVALQLALTEKNFEKIYVIGGTPCFVAENNWPGMPKITFNNFAAQVEENEVVGFDVFAYLNVQGTNNDKELYKKLKCMMKKIPDKQTLINGLKILAESDLRNDLKKITCPMEFILAENDRITNIGIADELPLYSDKIKVTTLKNTNHAMVYFTADIIAELLFSRCRS